MRAGPGLVGTVSRVPLAAPLVAVRCLQLRHQLHCCAGIVAQEHEHLAPSVHYLLRGVDHLAIIIVNVISYPCR